MRVSISGVTKLVKFKVSQGIEGFAFMGLKEMKKWGMVIDAQKETVVFRDKCVPFFQTKAKLMLSCAALGTEEAPTDKSPVGLSVRLTESVVLKPNADMMVTGIVDIGSNFVPDQTFSFDPITLKERYGLMAPRAIMKVGSDRKVPILLKKSIS